MIFRKSETDSIQSKSERKVKGKSFSRVLLFATPWTTQSMEFSSPEYWSRQPFPSPGDLPDPGVELSSPTLQADSLPTEPQGKSIYIYICLIVTGRNLSLVFVNISTVLRFSSVQFSRSVMSDSLLFHESQHARPPCPSPTPGVHSNSHPSSW